MKSKKLILYLSMFFFLLFTINITSHAETGWVQKGGKWYYYTTEGEKAKNEWRKDTGGNYYYLGKDGTMAYSQWTELSGGGKAYVNANGIRVANEWRLLPNPGMPASSAKYWFYFDSSGKMVSGKKIINGAHYCFSSEGHMLTGWVISDGQEYQEYFGTEKADDLYYYKEDGQRAFGWVYLTAPEDFQGGSPVWYYFKATGPMRKNDRANINGKTYIFDEEGHMLSGWVYEAGGKEDSLYIEVNEMTDTTNFTDMERYYYCGSKDDGSLKRNAWVISSPPGTNSNDQDISKEWYFISSNGTPVFAGGSNLPESSPCIKGLTKNIGSYYYSGDTVQAGFKKIGGKYYTFDSEGRMLSGLLFVQEPMGTSYKPGYYYFGSSGDGSMKTGSVSLKNDDGLFFSYYFTSLPSDTNSKGQGYTGVQSGKLFLNGLAVTADADARYQVKSIHIGEKNSYFFIVNESGRIMTGQSSYKDSYGRKYRSAGKDASGIGYKIEMQEPGGSWVLWN